jgi:hypothetical protein
MMAVHCGAGQNGLLLKEVKLKAELKHKVVRFLDMSHILG